MATMLTQASNPKKLRKEELTKGDIQSILRMSKLLGDLSNDLKLYHFVMVDQIEE